MKYKAHCKIVVGFVLSTQSRGLCAAGILKLNKHIRRKITSLHNTKRPRILRGFFIYLPHDKIVREQGEIGVSIIDQNCVYNLQELKSQNISIQIHLENSPSKLNLVLFC